MSQPNAGREQDRDESESQMEEEESNAMAHRHGNNFANNNAFDESLRESPIK